MAGTFDPQLRVVRQRRSGDRTDYPQRLRLLQQAQMMIYAGSLINTEY